MTYEKPDFVELGSAEELTLGGSCSGCDCCCGAKSNTDTTIGSHVA